MAETPSSSASVGTTEPFLRSNEDAANSWTVPEPEQLLRTLRNSIADPAWDYPVVLGAIAEAAHALTEASAAALAMRRDGVVVCVGRSGENAPDLGQRLGVDSGISGECLRTGKILRCDDTQKDFRADPAVCLQLGIASIASVPLHQDGRVVGILEAFSGRTFAFAEEHMQALQQLARLAEQSYRKELGIPEETYAAVIEPSLPAPSPPVSFPRAQSAAAAIGAYFSRRTRLYLTIGATVTAVLLISILGWRRLLPANHRQSAQVTAQAPPSTDDATPPGTALTWNAKTERVKPGHAAKGVQQAAKLDKDTSQQSPSTVPARAETHDEGIHREPQPTTTESVPPVLIASNGDRAPLATVLSAEPALPRFTTPVSQGVTDGVLTHRVQPVYPPQAIPLRLAGAVVLEATIAEDGRVRDLNLLRGNRTLAQAAIAAVSQWRYKPYLLNGKPVAMKTEITVDFKAP